MRSAFAWRLYDIHCCLMTILNWSNCHLVMTNKCAALNWSICMQGVCLWWWMRWHHGFELLWFVNAGHFCCQKHILPSLHFHKKFNTTLWNPVRTLVQSPIIWTNKKGFIQLINIPEIWPQHYFLISWPIVCLRSSYIFGFILRIMCRY